MNPRSLLIYLLTIVFSLSPGFAEKTQRAPDVLFIAIDDMNDWTTLFDEDNPIQTPNLKRPAERGCFFTRAYCASPGCNPSRTAIMSGLRPTTSGVYGNPQVWREKLPDAVTLTVDTSRSSTLPGVLARPPEVAPFLKGKEKTVKLRVFVDKSVVEVFVDGRQCAAVRVYPGREDSLGVSLRSIGGHARLVSLAAWQMENIYK